MLGQSPISGGPISSLGFFAPGIIVAPPSHCQILKFTLMLLLLREEIATMTQGIESKLAITQEGESQAALTVKAESKATVTQKV